MFLYQGSWLVLEIYSDSVMLVPRIKKDNWVNLWCFCCIVDDGSCYFDEKLVDAQANEGPISASSSVVRGLTALATSSSESLNVRWSLAIFIMFHARFLTFHWWLCASEFQLPGDKILCLAKFFLGIGIPGTPKDLYHQIDALACLENNRQAIITLIWFCCFWSLLYWNISVGIIT